MRGRNLSAVSGAGMGRGSAGCSAPFSLFPAVEPVPELPRRFRHIERNPPSWMAVGVERVL